MPLSRSLRAGVALLLATAVAAVVVLTSQPTPAPADINLNNLDCHGHISKATPATDEVGDTNISWVIACNGPFTGFQLLSSNEIQGLSTEAFGADAKTGAVVPTDQFSCNGDLPGYGVNCVGFANFTDNKLLTYDPSQRSYDKISGTFTISEDICAEPRTDVILFVSTATKKGGAANGDIVQALSGPFELGRPHRTGCKSTGVAGKTRIPKTGLDTSGDGETVGR